MEIRAARDHLHRQQQRRPQPWPLCTRQRLQPQRWTVAVTIRDRRYVRRVAAVEPISVRRRSLAEPSECVMIIFSLRVAAVAAAKRDDYKVGRPPRRSCFEAGNICLAAYCRPTVTIPRPGPSAASDRHRRPRPYRHAPAEMQTPLRLAEAAAVTQTSSTTTTTMTTPFLWSDHCSRLARAAGCCPWGRGSKRYLGCNVPSPGP